MAAQQISQDRNAHQKSRTRHGGHQSQTITTTPTLKGNSGIFKPRPYFWHELRLSTHREQFGESRRPSEDI